MTAALTVTAKLKTPLRQQQQKQQAAVLLLLLLLVVVVVVERVHQAGLAGLHGRQQQQQRQRGFLTQTSVRSCLTCWGCCHQMMKMTGWMTDPCLLLLLLLVAAAVLVLVLGPVVVATSLSPQLGSCLRKQQAQRE
jgi:ATP/ADP translocase